MNTALKIGAGEGWEAFALSLREPFPEFCRVVVVTQRYGAWVMQYPFQAVLSRARRLVRSRTGQIQALASDGGFVPGTVAARAVQRGRSLWVPIREYDQGVPCL